MKNDKIKYLQYELKKTKGLLKESYLWHMEKLLYRDDMEYVNLPDFREILVVYRNLINNNLLENSEQEKLNDRVLVYLSILDQTNMQKEFEMSTEKSKSTQHVESTDVNRGIDFLMNSSKEFAKQRILLQAEIYTINKDEGHIENIINFYRKLEYKNGEDDFDKSVCLGRFSNLNEERNFIGKVISILDCHKPPLPIEIRKLTRGVYEKSRKLHI